MVKEELLYFWLALGNMSVKRQNTLLEIYSSVNEIASEVKSGNQKLKLYVGEKSFLSLKQTLNRDYLELLISEYEKIGIYTVAKCNPIYPERLRQTEVNPPNILFYKGNISLLNTRTLGVVGTRTCSRYGKESTERLVTELAEYGLTIVSGLATGVDAYAHAATLRSGGNTIAVLGSGLNKVTPAANIRLAKAIEERGLLITEYPPDVEATVYTFPMRNRIISGLSEGVMVVEAGLKSGTLITANYALEQGREVFAVPGNITSSVSQGTNGLIKRGATIVTCAKDVLDYYHIERKEKSKVKSIQLDFSEEKIYNLCKDEIIHFDELLNSSEMKPHELIACLSMLEMKGLIRKEPSNYYKKSEENI